MGIFRTTTTPRPEEEKEEHLSGIANMDNSEMGGERSSVNDYSVDLNFVSLHLNTLASSGALILIVLISLLIIRFIFTGGATRMLDRLMDMTCLPTCCCRPDPQGHPEPSAPVSPAQQQVPDVVPQQGPGGPPGGPPGLPGGSQQDLQGPNLSEIQNLQKALIDEIKQLKSSVRYCKRLEEVTVGSVRGLRDEVADMRALCREELAERRGTMQFLRENYTSETRDCTQDSRVYPQLPNSTDMDDQTHSMMREFFSSLVEPGIPKEVFYRLDENTSESSESCGSGNLSIDQD